MATYAEWLELEKLLEVSTEAVAYFTGKYQAHMVRWMYLREKMGRFCPMARGVLKMLVMLEADNTKLIESTKAGKWIT